MLRTVFFLLALAAASGGVMAGGACSDAPPTPDSVRKGLQLALKTFQALDQSGEKIALIGRVGSDLSKHKLRYSHIGMVWRDHPKGRWSVVHMLNQCGTANSALYDEGLGNFFNDDPFAYEPIVVFPGADSQERLVLPSAPHCRQACITPATTWLRIRGRPNTRTRTNGCSRSSQRHGRPRARCSIASRRRPG